MDESNLEKIKALKGAYKNTFSGEDGLLVLDDLKKACFYNTTTINTEPHITSFNEGQRSVLLHILTCMRLDTVQLEKIDEERFNDEGQS